MRKSAVYTTLLAAIGLGTVLLSGAHAEQPPQPAQPEAGDSYGPGPNQTLQKVPKDKAVTLANRTPRLNELYDELAKTNDEPAAAALVKRIAELWAFSGSPTSDVLIGRAGAAATVSDARTAQVFLDAVVELQPDYAHGFFMRALTFKLQNDSNRMLGDLRRALALDARHFDALKALAIELSEIGRKKQAIEAYEKMLQIFPAAAKSNDPVLKALAQQLGGQEL